jgi:pyruvate ferredoxin oxidoreductase alpha subunit
VAVLGGAPYSYFRHQMHLASRNALQAHEEVAADFARLFGRQYGLVEGYRLEGAEDVLVMSNAFATKGRAAVDAARAQGRRVGLLRLRVIRPWPGDTIARILRGRRGVAVIDQNLAPGLGGILFQEIAASLYQDPQRPRALCSFIGGLGGKNISDGEFEAIFEQTAQAGAAGRGLGPVLLYTEAERREIEQLQSLAASATRQT